LHNIFKISYTGHNQSKLVPFAGKKISLHHFHKNGVALGNIYIVLWIRNGEACLIRQISMELIPN